MPVQISSAGYLSNQTEIKDIELHRGDDGLGFNIRGGTDAPYIKEDSGIFVTKIRDSGAAITSGLLNVGDKIVEINGTDLTAVKHNEAVQAFVSSGSKVSLKIIANHYDNIIENRQRRCEEEQAQRKVWFFAGSTVMAVIAGYFIYRRMRRA